MIGRARPRRRDDGGAGDPQLLERLLRELEGHPGVNLHLEGPQAFMLVAELQLALRHPGNTGTAAEVARSVIRVIGDTLGPEARVLIERGWHE